MKDQSIPYIILGFLIAVLIIALIQLSSAPSKVQCHTVTISATDVGLYNVHVDPSRINTKHVTMVYRNANGELDKFDYLYCP